MIENKYLSFLYQIFLIASFTVNLNAQSYNIKPIITTETKLLPGIELTIFGLLPNLSINNIGDIVFTAVLSDGTVGILSSDQKNTKLLLKSVQAQPINESVFLILNSTSINDNGSIVFCGHKTPDRLGIFKRLGNDTIPLIMQGDPVNGLESTIDEISCVKSLGNVSINNKDETTFKATLSDGRRGLLLYSAGQIIPIILEGDFFPVFDGNETLSFADSPVINDKGEIVFRGRFLNKNEDGKMGVFLFSDGEIVPIKLPGQDAPGTKGKIFSTFHFDEPTLGNNSEIVYFADYLTPGIDQPPGFDSRVSEFGLFLWSSGETKKLILTGDKVPGVNSLFFNTNSDGFSTNTINDSGDIVVSLAHSATSGTFLFSNEKTIPVVLDDRLFINPINAFIPSISAIDNKGNIIFQAIISNINMPNPISIPNGLFVAEKENILLEITDITPNSNVKGSRFKVKVKGKGFQPGASLSFSDNNIRIIKTEFNPLDASKTFNSSIKILPNTRFGFHDVIVTNPTGETIVLENGFRVTR